MTVGRFLGVLYLAVSSSLFALGHLAANAAPANASTSGARLAVYQGWPSSSKGIWEWVASSSLSGLPHLAAKAYKSGARLAAYLVLLHMASICKICLASGS